MPAAAADGSKPSDVRPTVDASTAGTWRVGVHGASAAAAAVKYDVPPPFVRSPETRQPTGTVLVPFSEFKKSQVRTRAQLSLGLADRTHGAHSQRASITVRV